MPNATFKLVLTGGPCAGKTTLLNEVARAHPDKVLALAETASVLITGGFPTWDTDVSRECFQTSIFRVQQQLENNYDAHYKGGMFLLDRGTVDCAAYWPKGAQDFFRQMGTTEEKELARYDHVIYLESAGESHYSRNNPSRLENWDLARRIDERTRGVWERHPHLTVIPCAAEFETKTGAARKLIEKILEKTGGLMPV